MRKPLVIDLTLLNRDQHKIDSGRAVKTKDTKVLSNLNLYFESLLILEVTVMCLVTRCVVKIQKYELNYVLMEFSNR